MNLYHASVYVSGYAMVGKTFARLSEPERRIRVDSKHILESYHYIHRQRYVDEIRADGIKVFLDSGAFSAFASGAKVDIGRYCDYIHANQDIIEQASVLDVIGDYSGTYHNQMEMERRGTRPLPCYHYGEPTEVLDWYIANYDYITIGGMVPISTPQLKIWLNRIWEEHLTNADGTPKLKVHGFGLTSFDLMAGYPWFSVDSSTWQALGSNGSIFMLGRGGRTLAVSKKAAQIKVYGQHFDSLSPPEQAAVLQELESRGFEMERMRENYWTRWTWNMWALPLLAQERGHMAQFKAVEQRLF